MLGEIEKSLWLRSRLGGEASVLDILRSIFLIEVQVHLSSSNTHLYVLKDTSSSHVSICEVFKAMSWDEMTKGVNMNRKGKIRSKAKPRILMVLHQENKK